MIATIHLRAAYRYYDMGLCPWPVEYRSKKAAAPWKPYQHTRPTREQLPRLFRADPLNVALLMGDVSGRLNCRDYDVAAAYHTWAAANPELAHRLATAKTANGYHVYFIGNCQGVKYVDASEIRGSGCYTLAWPSIHPCGAQYTWLIPPAIDNLLELHPYAVGLALPDAPSLESVTQNAQDIHDTQEYRGNDGVDVGDERLDALISATLPRGPGHRNRMLFEFARALKSLPEFSSAGIDDLRPIVREWHRRALPYITSQALEESLCDFIYAWERVKYPKGTGPMSVICEKARRRTPPKIAREKYPTHPPLQLLASLCNELQRAAGDEPFFLAARTAAEFLGVNPMQISRWLFLLRADGILVEVTKGGTKGNGRNASTYRYLGRQSA